MLHSGVVRHPPTKHRSSKAGHVDSTVLEFTWPGKLGCNHGRKRPSSAGAVLPAQVPAFQTGAVNGMAIASMVARVLWALLARLDSRPHLSLHVALSQIKERNEGGPGEWPSPAWSWAGSALA